MIRKAYELFPAEPWDCCLFEVADQTHRRHRSSNISLADCSQQVSRSRSSRPPLRLSSPTRIPPPQSRPLLGPYPEGRSTRRDTQVHRKLVPLDHQSLTTDQCRGDPTPLQDLFATGAQVHQPI